MASFPIAWTSLVVGVEGSSSGSPEWDSLGITRVGVTGDGPPRLAGGSSFSGCPPCEGLPEGRATVMTESAGVVTAGSSPVGSRAVQPLQSCPPSWPAGRWQRYGSQHLTSHRLTGLGANGCSVSSATGALVTLPSDGVGWDAGLPSGFSCS